MPDTPTIKLMMIFLDLMAATSRAVSSGRTNSTSASNSSTVDDGKHAGSDKQEGSTTAVIQFQCYIEDVLQRYPKTALHTSQNYVDTKNQILSFIE